MNRLRFLLALALLPLGMACSDNGPKTLTEDEYVGLYTLTEINGVEIPTATELDGLSVTVTNGAVSLMTEREWSASLSGNLAGDVPTTLDFGGDLTVSGHKFRLNDENDYVFAARLDGDVLTVNYGTLTLKFVRVVPV